MSAGAFLTGITAALLFSVSAVSADSHGKKAKSDHGDGAAYSSSFPFRSQACGIPSEGKVTAETLRGSSNAFESFVGGGSYAAAFFKSGSTSASAAEHHLVGAGSSVGGSSFGGGSKPGQSEHSVTPSAGKSSNGKQGAAGQGNGHSASSSTGQGQSTATAKRLAQGAA